MLEHLATDMREGVRAHAGYQRAREYCSQCLLVGQSPVISTRPRRARRRHHDRNDVIATL